MVDGAVKSRYQWVIFLLDRASINESDILVFCGSVIAELG